MMRQNPLKGRINVWALLLTGAVAFFAYRAFAQRYLKSGHPPEELIPKNVVTALTADLSTLGTHLKPLLKQAPLEDLFDDLRDETGVDFEQDVCSWAGRSAALSATRLDENADLCLYLSIRNRKAFQEGWQKVKRRLEKEFDEQFREHQHEGVSVYRMPATINGHKCEIAFAEVGDYLVIALDDSAVESAVEVYRGKKPSLASSEYYIRLKKELPSQAAMTSFVDLAGLSERMGGQSNQSSTMGACFSAWTVTLEKDRTRIDSATLAADKEAKEWFAKLSQMGNLSERSLAYFPEGTLVVGLLQAPGPQWQMWQRTILEDLCKQQKREWKEALRASKDAMGFDWEDVLKDFTGECAIGLVGFGQDWFPKAVLVTEARDAASLEEGVKEIRESLEDFDVEFDAERYQATRIFTPAEPIVEEGNFRLAPCYAVQGKVLIVASDEETLKEALRSAEGKTPSLKNTCPYQALRSKLPRRANFLYFADTGKMVEKAQNEMDGDERDVKRLLRALKKVRTISGGSEVRGDVYRDTCLIEGATAETVADIAEAAVSMIRRRAKDWQQPQWSQQQQWWGQ